MTDLGLLKSSAEAAFLAALPSQVVLADVPDGVTGLIWSVCLQPDKAEQEAEEAGRQLARDGARMGLTGFAPLTVKMVKRGGAKALREWVGIFATGWK